jgi:hypothetical protein
VLRGTCALACFRFCTSDSSMLVDKALRLAGSFNVMVQIPSRHVLIVQIVVAVAVAVAVVDVDVDVDDVVDVDVDVDESNLRFRNGIPGLVIV